MVDYIFTNIILPLVVGIVLIVIEKWLNKKQRPTHLSSVDQKKALAFVVISRGFFVVMVDYIFTSPLLSHIYFQLSKESSDRLNYKCGIIISGTSTPPTKGGEMAYDGYNT